MGLHADPPPNPHPDLARNLSSQSQEAPVHCIVVNCSRIASGVEAGPSKTYKDSKDRKHPRDLKERVISDVVREAVALQPSLIILDDLDLLAGGFSSRDDSGPSLGDEEKFSHWLAEVMDATHDHMGPQIEGRGAELVPSLVAWAATARDASDLHPVLKSAGRFDFQGGKGGKKDGGQDSNSNASLRLPALGSEARVGLLSVALGSRKVLLVDEGTGEPLSSDETKRVLERISGHAEGCDASDLGTVVDRAVHHALSDLNRAPALRSRDPGGLGSTWISERDLMEALLEFVPTSFWALSDSSRGTNKGKGKSDQGGWSNVGGMLAARAAIKEALELPFKYSKLVANAPLRLRTGKVKALVLNPTPLGNLSEVTLVSSILIFIRHIPSALFWVKLIEIPVDDISNIQKGEGEVVPVADESNRAIDSTQQADEVAVAIEIHLEIV